MNLQFASAMRQYGHKRFTDASLELNPFLEDDKNAVDPALNKEYAQFSAY